MWIQIIIVLSIGFMLYWVYKHKHEIEQYTEVKVAMDTFKNSLNPKVKLKTEDTK